MTLVLALDCADGLLLAADSQSTISTSGQSTRSSVDKLHDQWSNVAWSAAGHVGSTQHVEEKFNGAGFSSRERFDRSTRAMIRRDLCKAISEVLRPIFSDRVIVVPKDGSIATSFLFVGHAVDGPFILEVHPNLSDSDHTGVGYSAIGSGDIFTYVAMAGLAHFTIRQRTLTEAKLIAYRIMEDAVNVAAYGLGPPVRMLEIAKPKEGDARRCGQSRRLSNDELRMLSEKVLEWKTLESDVLSDYLGLNVAPPEEAQTSPDANPAS